MPDMWLRLWPLGYLIVGRDLISQQREVKWGLFANQCASRYVDPCLIRGRRVLAG